MLEAKFGLRQVIIGDATRDAEAAVLNAIGAGKVTRADINTFLKTIDVQGVTKEIKFDSQGEVTSKNVYIYKVSGGQITAAGTVS